MPQQQDNAAQPILDDKLLNWTRRITGRAPTAQQPAQQPASPSKPDNSWHDEMVKEADESNVKAAQAKPADHKAAVSRMQPQHVHQLVQDAHAGKYGADAQKMAQSAMQPQQQSSQSTQPSFTVSNADSGNGSGGTDDAASIFGGR